MVIVRQRSTREDVYRTPLASIDSDVDFDSLFKNLKSFFVVSLS